jgi:leucyl-tRNA synthetase
MAVPGHDERDREFADRYGLPVRAVISEDSARLENSAAYTGLACADAIAALGEAARAGGFGEPAVTFRLRDWGISRQRFWGTPIPIIHCGTCGMVPVPESDLPVLLPEGAPLQGVTGSPLGSVDSFVNVTCPKCGGAAKRETDTMDTFVDSSWYFYRYTDPKNDRAPFDPAAAAPWFPVDLYIGGIAHATGHLIYCRFFHKFLRELGMAHGDEPVENLLTQGMVVSYSYLCPEHRYISPESVVQGADPDKWLCPEDGRELTRVLEKMS